MAKIFNPIDRDKISDSVHELYLMAQNNYPNRWNPIQENQQRKVKNGTYDFYKSVKLQRYLIDDAWRELKKNDGYGRYNWRGITTKEKNEAAILLAEDFYNNIGYEFKDEVKKESGKNFKTPDGIIKHYRLLRNKKRLEKINKKLNKKFRR